MMRLPVFGKWESRLKRSEANVRICSPNRKRPSESQQAASMAKTKLCIAADHEFLCQQRGFPRFWTSKESTLGLISV